MTISRRVFVKSGSLALVSFGLDPLFLARAAFATTRLPVYPSIRPILVCLFQRGAVDGLNMVVPHGDPLYYRERPRIAVPESDVVDLDGHFGLHPRLAALKPLWENKSLAAIHAIGSPDSTRSHFDAQDYMESGTPGIKATADGWLNRYCQHDREHQDTPFRAVAFGPQLPRILAGSAPSLAIDDLQAFGLRAPQPAARDRLTRAFEELYAGSATGLLSTSSQEAFEAVQMLKQVSPDQYRPGNGADYPRGRLGKAMMQIRDRATGSSLRDSPTLGRRSRPSPRIWARGCGTWWYSRCRSSAARCGRTATAGPTMGTRPRCWSWGAR